MIIKQILSRVYVNDMNEAILFNKKSTNGLEYDCTTCRWTGRGICGAYKDIEKPPGVGGIWLTISKNPHTVIACGDFSCRYLGVKMNYHNFKKN